MINNKDPDPDPDPEGLGVNQPITHLHVGSAASFPIIMDPLDSDLLHHRIDRSLILFSSR